MRIADRVTGSGTKGASLFARRLLAVVSGLARALADVVSPAVCVACRTPIGSHDALCASCWRQIDFIRPPLCDRLGIPLPFDAGEKAVSAAAIARPPAYDRARAVARHAGVMRDLVHDLKYGDSHHGLRLFGRWLRLCAAELLVDADLIVPVPLARWRLWSRRFNQSALLAAALARECGLPHQPLVLQRTRATRSQVGLSFDQRRRNVQGAFAVDPRLVHLVYQRNVLLVDDVITTGATVEAIARVLRRAGAKRIDVVALARVTDAIVPPA